MLVAHSNNKKEGSIEATSSSPFVEDEEDEEEEGPEHSFADILEERP